MRNHIRLDDGCTVFSSLYFTVFFAVKKYYSNNQKKSDLKWVFRSNFISENKSKPSCLSSAERQFPAWVADRESVPRARRNKSDGSRGHTPVSSHPDK